MSCIYDKTPWSLRTVVTPDTVKIMQKSFDIFVEELKIFYKMVYKTLYFGWSIPEKLRYKVKVSIFKKKKAQKKALALKGLKNM